jgi:hypothetical protein
MQLGQYTGNTRDALGYLNAQAPTVGTFGRSNLPRAGLDDVAALATGVMTSVPIFLAAGDVVTNLTFISGATAADTPLNWWFALYSNAATPALLAQTADQTTGAWAAETVKTVALSAAQTISTTGVYWAAVMVKATATPSLVGCSAAKPVLTGERNLAQRSGSTLTTTAPATIASPTVNRLTPLAIAS